MKRRAKVIPGDIIAVPLREGMVAVGIVLHVSTLFRGAVMIGFYKQVFPSIEDIDLTKLKGDFIDTPNYTGKKLITSGRWKIVGNSPDLLRVAEVPYLRVASSLYYKDEEVRRLSPSEWGAYTELLGQGGIALEEKLYRYFIGT